MKDNQDKKQIVQRFTGLGFLIVMPIAVIMGAITGD
jgi:hypothetical protein